jgi:hypothetical protein
MRNILIAVALAFSSLASAQWSAPAQFGPAPEDQTFIGKDGVRYDVAVSSFIADSKRTVGAVIVTARTSKDSASFRVLVQGDHCRAGGGVAIVEFPEALQARPWGATDEPLDVIVGVICSNLQ